MTSSSDPFPPLNIPWILRQAEINPSRGLGQNFLNDDHILSRIVEASAVSSLDTVLEIGPGLGSLTRHLANASKKVTAVEIDRKLFPLVQNILQPFTNIHLVCGDILEQRLDQLNLPPGYLVVANIPYYITSAVIRYLLEASVKPARIVLTVQQEVAQRICASVGDLNLLALSVQVYGAPQVMMSIPSSAFYPPPKVDSAVVRIDLYPQSLIPSTDLNLFFQLCKAGFGQKRKTLRNSLSGGMHIPSAVVENRLKQVGIDPMRRAETLSLGDWQKLVDNWKINGV